jgi:hypothetical protein
MRPGKRLLRPAPPQRLGLLRVLVGVFATGYLAARYPHLVSFGGFPSERFDPVGVVSIVDEPLSAGIVTMSVLAAIATGAAFTAGWHYRITGPAFALLFLWVTTYRNSWGTVLHTENLLALHVLVVGFVAAADAFSLDEKRTGERPGESWRYGWPIRLVTVVTVLAYFVGGWAKLRFGGLDWWFGDTLRNQIAYDNLRKLILGDFYSPFGGWLTQYPWVFTPMAIGTMVVELGAPLALLGDRIGRWFSVVAWGFHASIVMMMMIVFPYQLSFIAFAAFWPVERGWERVRGWRRVSPPEPLPSPHA